MSHGDAMLALTFDDGPDPIWTRCVLEQLRAVDVRATFFVLGERVRAAPGLLEEILADGHTVGLHGDRHLDHSKVTRQALAADTRSALETLREAGVEPTLWRLPWGRSGPDTARLAREHRLEIVGWDIDTHDWRGDRWADQPAEHRQAVRNGGVVLLHDAIGPGAPRTACANTVELIVGMVREAAEAGVAVGALRPGGALRV